MLKNPLDMPKKEAGIYLKELGFSEEMKAVHNLRLLSETPFNEHLEKFISIILASPSPDDALNNAERVGTKLSPEVIKLLIKNREQLRDFVTICGSSNLLSNIFINNPVYIEQFFLEGGLNKRKDRPVFLNELNGWIQDLHGFNSIVKALRLFKQREYLRIGARDILGLSSMQETTKELSELADASLEIACRFCLSQLEAEYGTPIYVDIDGLEKKSEFAIIGMGKLGGMELNFSSDIDIIYIYSSDRGETSGITKAGELKSKISIHAFYVKLSELITRLIGSVTEDGIVFRVDLNLRPEGKNGDLANSLRSAEIYYESWGQTWERAAMIKARPVAGSINLGEDFLKMLEPFVYRKYLDFTGIEEIRGMKEKIDLSLLRANPDIVDVKLGVGGIREIEFFIQAIQLINGGKDKSIRGKNTISVIETLKEKNYINPPDAADILTSAYTFFRNVEHRIQIVEGRQAHAIPSKTTELTRLSRMLSFKNTADKEKTKISASERFWNEYKMHASAVHEIYSDLFYKSSKELDKGIPEDVLLLLNEGLDKKELMEKLSKIGFEAPQKAYENIRLLKDGPPFAHFSAKTQILLKRIAPYILAQIITSPAPDMALEHLERFISAIGARTTFYSLMAENKKVMDLLVKLFGTSVFLSAAFIEHPENLDMLLSPDLNRQFKDRKDFIIELSAMLETGADYEEMLDIIRRFRNSEILRIGINDIFKELEPADVSKQITFLADACLIKAYDIGIDELLKRFGRLRENAKFAVLGLGKLGGEELAYSSDLDIIFVYSTSGETIGPKSISNHEFFAKLSQRIITILSLVTREGFVFKIDTRLRPSGSSGPLVVSEDAFMRYHKEAAKLWEKQAMTKARFIAGDYEFGTRIVKDSQEHIYSTPPADEDLKELYRIRQRIELEVAKERAERYNIKFGKGGLIEVEFIVQILQLKAGGGMPSVRTPNTIEAITALKNARIITEGEHRNLNNAYKFYRLLENRLRIVNNRAEGNIIRGSAELMTLARRLNYTGSDADKKLLDDYLKYADNVRELYKKVIGVKEEI